MGEVHYELAIRRWRRGGNIEILSIHDTQIAVFPLEFVAKGEDNTWQFVLDVVQQLVEPLPDHPATIFTDDGEPVNLVESPSAGIFRYKQLNVQSDPSFTRGPEYFSRFKPPTLMTDQSTRSASSQVSGRPEQASFKLRLAARDGACVVSEVDVELCVAAHIVPQSRPDVYQQVLEQRLPDMYDTSAGLLLETGLHRTFDSLNWSLYRKGDTFYVHYFLPKTKEHANLHGKALPPDRFSRYQNPPDPKLVAWHYNQAVKARIRGFSAGMDVAQMT